MEVVCNCGGSNYWIEGAAVVIALCALGVSIWQGWVTRQHARLSVQPYLSIRKKINEERKHGALEIINSGLGTATIKRIVIKSLSKKFSDIDFSSDFCSYQIAELLSSNFICPYVNYTVSHIGSYLMAGESIYFFELQFQEDGKSYLYTHFEQFVSDLEIHIQYESSYLNMKEEIWNCSRL